MRVTSRGCTAGEKSARKCKGNSSRSCHNAVMQSAAAGCEATRPTLPQSTQSQSAYHRLPRPRCALACGSGIRRCYSAGAVAAVACVIAVVITADLRLAMRLSSAIDHPLGHRAEFQLLTKSLNFIAAEETPGNWAGCRMCEILLPHSYTHCVSKNTPDIFSCNLSKHFPI